MTNTKKHYFNFENITIKGNIGSDILLKTKNKERVEFSVAVNKFNKETKDQTTKWFKIVAFKEDVVGAVKNNSGYKKGANVQVNGKILAEVYKGKPILKIVADQIALNIQVIETTA